MPCQFFLKPVGELPALLEVFYWQADNLDPATLPLKVPVSVIGVSATVSVVRPVHFKDDCPSVPEHDDVWCPSVASLQSHPGEGRNGDRTIGRSRGLDPFEYLIHLVLLAAAERKAIFYRMVGRRPLPASLTGGSLLRAIPQMATPVLPYRREDLLDVHTVHCRVPIAQSDVDQHRRDAFPNLTGERGHQVIVHVQHGSHDVYVGAARGAVGVIRVLEVEVRDVREQLCGFAVSLPIQQDGCLGQYQIGLFVGVHDHLRSLSAGSDGCSRVDRTGSLLRAGKAVALCADRAHQAIMMRCRLRLRSLQPLFVKPLPARCMW
ncbi:hypothetical protein RKD47_006401 [Streptomyces albogriseolus]